MTASGAEPGRRHVVASARTDVGRQRSENQDAFTLTPLGDAAVRPDRGGSGPNTGTVVPVSARLDATAPGFLFVVADGMGGAAAGEIASRLAVTTLDQVVASGWEEHPPDTAAALGELMSEAVSEANGRIHDWAERHREYRGMGSTLTALGLLGPTAIVRHVGDSRAYLVRDGEVRQITEDQTVAQKLVESGSLSPEEALESRQSHVLLRALGTEPEVEAQPEAIELRDGDGLLLCTDGLSHLVPPTRIAEILRAAPDPATAVDRLIEGANDGGGHDNITVVFARVGAGDATAGGS